MEIQLLILAKGNASHLRLGLISKQDYAKMSAVPHQYLLILKILTWDVSFLWIAQRVQHWLLEIIQQEAVKVFVRIINGEIQLPEIVSPSARISQQLILHDFMETTQQVSVYVFKYVLLHLDYLGKMLLIYVLPNVLL